MNRGPDCISECSLQRLYVEQLANQAKYRMGMEQSAKTKGITAIIYERASDKQISKINALHLKISKTKMCPDCPLRIDD